MKTIIAVAFIAILTYAFAQKPSQSNRCKHKAMQNFDSTKYLQIPRAYATHSKDEIPYLTVCGVLETTQKSDSTVDTLMYGYYQDSGKTHYSEAQCNTKVESVKTGQFYEDCIVINDTLFEDPKIYKDIVHKVYVSVIDTDYENYSILYRCLEDEVDGFQDTILVLKIDKDANDDLVKEALGKVGMDLQSFNPYTNNTYCDDIKI
uniref:Pc156, similar to Td33,salivary lipocalin n=1 Tax=Panstrongylus chinai TaxID=156444 RepID=A0A286P0W8_9HEMI|nr:Pc156, similar to Td33,salivary lipocalin [Panstrongylus chinai]